MPIPSADRASQPTPGPICRDGTFLWQLDTVTGVNLWSGHLAPNNCNPSEYVEKACALFVEAPDLLEDSRALVNDVAGALGAFRADVIAAIGFTNWQLIDQRVAKLELTIARATGASNG